MKRKREHFSHFWGWYVQWRENKFLEREAPTSLYISRLPDRRFASGQEAKLFYAKRAARGHRFWGVSITPRGRGFLLLDLILFKSFVNDLECLRP